MAESRVKDENYFQVSGWMINRLKLKGVTLELFAIIYGFTQDGESEFTGSIQYLCDFTGTSRPTVINALKTLVASGLLEKQTDVKNGITFNRYKVSLPVVKELLTGSKEILPGGSKKTLPNNKYINNKDINNSYKYIVEFLNEKAEKNYKYTTESTQRHINARFAEGFTVEDFKTVIEKKCSEWKGSEMEKYLRPETLFGNKFEGYLNEKTASDQKGKQGKFDHLKGGILIQ